MKLTLENSSRVNLVRAYSPTEVHIGEQVVRTRCIVTPAELITDWAPLTYEQLELAHTDPLLALKPDILVLGTGQIQRFPPAKFRALFAQAGIGLEVMDLGAACRTYNVLVQEERKVAAALFLT